MAGHSKTKKNYTEAERRMFQERARKAVESRKQRAQAALQARQAPSSTTTKGSRRSSRVVQANNSSTSAHKHAVSEIEESGPQKRPRSGIKLPATKAARMYPPPQIVYPDAGEDEDPIQSFPSDGEHSESPLTDVDSEDVERDGTPSIDLEYDSDHSIKADISKGKRAQGKLQERFDFERPHWSQESAESLSIMKVEKYKQTPNRQRDHSTPMFDTSQHHSKHQVQASTKKLSYLSSSRNQMPLFNKMDGSDDYEIVEIPPPHDTSIFKSKKCSIKSGKKREIQRSEPNIKLEPIDLTIDSGLIVRQWNIATDLVFLPARGKINLTSQQPLVKEILYSAFKHMQRHLLFTDPWLHPAEKFRIGLKWLVDAARDCNSGAMALRLLDSSERDYAKYLITVVDGRLTSNCSAFRIAAEGVVPTEVVLTKATSEETTAHFEYILERNIGYPYIFPIDPQTKKENRTKPFRHSVVIKTLQQVSFLKSGSSSALHTLSEYFQPKLENPPEVPQQLLALTATAIYAVLKDYQLKPPTATPFQDEFFGGIYNDHMETLSDLAEGENTKSAFHPLLARIYQEAFGQSIRPEMPKVVTRIDLS